MLKKMRNKGIVNIVSISIAAVVIITAGFTGYYVSSTTAQGNVEDTLQISEVVVKNDDSGYLRFEEDKYADDAIEVQRRLESYDYTREDGKKVAYLTFDDGPSQFVTENILDVLNRNDVKATFFMAGNTIDKNSKSEDIIKRMVKEGHAIGNHTYSHDYKVLYPHGTADIDAFMQDVKKTEDRLKEIIGKDFKCRAIRMPGGSMSWKTKDLLTELGNQDYASVDWNALNGDAEGKKKNPEQLLNKLKETTVNKDTVVVLMHDTDAKEDTFNYLQSAIDYLKSEGYEFRTLK
ncbi:MAG: polysaccharide deacetylase family protein [Clostridium sp.]